MNGFSGPGAGRPRYRSWPSQDPRTLACNGQAYDSGMEQSTDRPVLVDVAGSGPVRVTVRLRDHEEVGEADGQAPADAAAVATLRALDALTPEAVTFGLEWCGAIQPDDDSPPVLLVLAKLTIAGVPMRQSGTAIVRDGDVAVAAAQAALDALNRRLEIMEL